MVDKVWKLVILGILMGAGIVMMDLKESQSAEKIKLRMGHVVAPGSIFDVGAKKFAELVEKKSNGRIEMPVFPSGQLGQEREIMEGMPLGIVDAYVFGTSTLTAIVPEIGDCDLPYLYRSKEHADKVLEGEVGQHWLSLLESKGIKGVGWGAGGFRSSLNSRKKIEKIDDLKGMKFRIAGGPIYIAMYRALGANAIQMTWSEVYTAMQQKVIDGLECPPNVMVSSRLYEVGKFLTLDEHTYSALVFGVAMPTFKKLTADLQKAVLEAGFEAGRYMRDEAQKFDGDSSSQMATKGVTVNSIDKEPLIKAMQPVYDEMAKNKGLIAKIRSIQ